MSHVHIIFASVFGHTRPQLEGLLYICTYIAASVSGRPQLASLTPVTWAGRPLVSLSYLPDPHHSCLLLEPRLAPLVLASPSVSWHHHCRHHQQITSSGLRAKPSRGLASSHGLAPNHGPASNQNLASSQGLALKPGAGPQAWASLLSCPGRVDIETHEWGQRAAGAGGQQLRSRRRPQSG